MTLKTVLKSAGRPKADAVEGRLAELIGVAAHLFLVKGYSNVSLDMIAREARVAVRTIYVKFGGKAGLLAAVLRSRREQFFLSMDMDTDERPIREVLDDFARRLYDMTTTAEATAMLRMLAGEANNESELIETFFAMGPNVTRESINRYLNRPSIRLQLRDDLPFKQLPVHLINCILGDELSRVFVDAGEETQEERYRALAQRMELFYRSVLR